MAMTVDKAHVVTFTKTFLQVYYGRNNEEKTML